jgi:carotenoid cleavage dioxygenase-like enzyme
MVNGVAVAGPPASLPPDTEQQQQTQAQKQKKTTPPPPCNLAEAEDRLELGKTTRFPAQPFNPFYDPPCRFEAEVYNCIVRGNIPKDIDGTFYRCMPDFAWAPLYEDEVHMNGDGCIDAVRIHDGHADFKQRYVRTERFVIERAARQAVFGKYRNRYTDDPRVKHKIHSTANTHVVFFENQLLALKEDSHPYAMDPDTLSTKGSLVVIDVFSLPGPEPDK